MGYSGLTNVQDSDSASDMTADITDAIAKVLSKHLSENDNEFNTSGAVNVGLFNESILYPVRNSLGWGNDKLEKVLQRARKKLEKELESGKKTSAEDWNGGDNKQMHLRAYKRMLNKLDEVIEEFGGDVEYDD